ncbi:triphosphoribosyl-dephospho-CoA synthase [Plebeiibacterium marinum]|uniref:Triphosphoribosyl-dephospho-CoA synthase n=1 Tax=Plebeiibacterium marinum TaxID=2992111 RepID=A0AAE3ME71_9BACT|nr:triphosphoribosyl-dephospho-CoA synthase [Plebeiobacterium marinum]MCW3806298.1 triphosphoribosyl-dephospho-CoA synthase [Plebeiobacterium marinum]
MQQVKTEIERLLEAREMRMQQKLALTEGRFHMVSLQLNIPGLPKTSEIVKEFILHVDSCFQKFYTSRCCVHSWEKHFPFCDEAGDWIAYLFDHELTTASFLKETTEAFEETFVLGRIVDLDVLDIEGIPISSGKAKSCFICNEPAESCRKNKRHDLMMVRERMLSDMKSYLDKENSDALIKKVTGYITYALLQEVALSPKPGLVCRNHNGAHTDMDFVSFLQSTAMISPYLQDIGNLAISFNDKDISKALPQIREIGLQMEKAMLLATQNINTHKGAIFLMAISMFSIIRVVRHEGTFEVEAFSNTISELTKGIVERELITTNTHMKLSHGQMCFLDYGPEAAGARGEAQNGMPTVVKHALPFLNGLLKENLTKYNDRELSDALIPVLLKIMSVNSDTNVIFRKDINTLAELKERSQKALDHWQKGEKDEYNKLVSWCNNKGISPGGSADLLAVTILLYQCKYD